SAIVAPMMPVTDTNGLRVVVTVSVQISTDLDLAICIAGRGCRQAHARHEQREGVWDSEMLQHEGQEGETLWAVALFSLSPCKAFHGGQSLLCDSSGFGEKALPRPYSQPLRLKKRICPMAINAIRVRQPR